MLDSWEKQVEEARQLQEKRHQIDSETQKDSETKAPPKQVHRESEPVNIKRSAWKWKLSGIALIVLSPFVFFVDDGGLTCGVFIGGLIVFCVGRMME